jgi:hypothetical protein
MVQDAPRGDEVLTEVGHALVGLAATLTNCLRAIGAHRH